METVSTCGSMNEAVAGAARYQTALDLSWGTRLTCQTSEDGGTRAAYPTNWHLVVNQPGCVTVFAPIIPTSGHDVFTSLTSVSANERTWTSASGASAFPVLVVCANHALVRRV